VIHAAGMGQDLRTDTRKIVEVTRNSLLRAEEKKLKSVAFPAIGTGVGGFSVQKCANIMLTTTVEFLQKSKSLNEVRFVLFDEPAYIAFKDQLSKIFSAS